MLMLLDDVLSDRTKLRQRVADAGRPLGDGATGWEIAVVLGAVAMFVTLARSRTRQ